MLPDLRDDLSLHRGPVAADGAPTWVVHDPVRNRFFSLSWAAYEILARWSSGSPAEIARAVDRDTTLSPAARDVEDVASFLIANELVAVGDPTMTDRLAARAAAGKRSWFHWLLHHYLFFRIPVVRPNEALDRLLPWVRWMGTPWFRVLTLTALLVGLVLAGRQWDLFVATLVDVATPSGLAAYALAIVVVKVTHELAHACTLKTYGGRVPTMGVAFLVLWPVLYTDVNEAWLLPDRRHRLMVGAAGVVSELTMAAWATLAWAFLPEGPARQAAFVLATVTWVSSLAINLAPFMRFDGYFLVMDALDMPNLHARAFAMARWWLRERLFALDAPAPEPMSSRRRALLVAFAVLVWIYRLVLFIGIAVMVYHVFFKALGALLFVLEVTWFVLMPIWSEVVSWKALRRDVLARRRVWWTVALFVGAVSIAVVPWQGRVAAPAVVKAADSAEIYLPFPARLDGLLVTPGQVVEAGQPLMTFVAPDLDQRRAGAEARLERRRAEALAAVLDPGQRQNVGITAGTTRIAEAELLAIDAESRRLVLLAPVRGTFVDPLPGMSPGDWLSPRQLLGVVRGMSSQVVAYVAEEDIGGLSVGDGALFTPDHLDFPVRRGTITRIDPAPVKIVSELMLSSIHHGPIPSRRVGREIVPEAGFMRVVVAVEGEPPRVELPGTASLSGDRYGLAGRLFRSVVVVLVREWG